MAPKIFDEKAITQTVSSVPENLVGKRIALNATELTNDLNKYYLKIFLKITSVNGTNVHTEFDGSECLQDYISRMVLRRIRRIDSVQDLKTHDNVKIRVKSLVIIPKKAKSSIEVKIREFVSALVKKEVESSTLNEFIQRVLSSEIKNKIIKTGRSIYPIRNFEIRKTEILREPLSAESRKG